MAFNFAAFAYIVALIVAAGLIFLVIYHVSAACFIASLHLNLVVFCALKWNVMMVSSVGL